MQTEAALACMGMAERPIFHPELGLFLKEVRLKRGFGELTHAVLVAQQRGLKRLTRQVLLRLEAGATKMPDADVVRELSELYASEDLPLTVVRHVYGRDLLGPASTASSSKDSSIPDGGLHAAQARVLQERLVHARKTLSAINHSIATLVDDLADRSERTSPGRARASPRELPRSVDRKSAGRGQGR